LDTDALDALIVVSETDLPALLESGYVGEYRLISPDEAGLDAAALTGAGQFSPDALLTPRDLGLDGLNNRFPWGGFAPFFRGFHHCCPHPRLPIFFFKPFPPLPPPVALPVFPRVAVVVVPPPLMLPPAPPPVALAPPAPLAPRAPLGQRAVPVPVIPEADSLALLGLGLVALAGAAWWRSRK
jgi:hypothetical protein